MIEFAFNAIDENTEEKFYKLRDDVNQQEKCFLGLRRLCVDGSEFKCIDMIDDALIKLHKLRASLQNTPVFTSTDIKKWRAALNKLIDRLIVIYREHKKAQKEGNAA